MKSWIALLLGVCAAVAVGSGFANSAYAASPPTPYIREFVMQSRPRTSSVNGTNISPLTVTASGSAPQFVCSGTGVCEIDSAATDATTSASVPAIKLKATQALTAGDLVFDVQDSVGSSLFSVNGSSSILMRGAMYGPATTNLGLRSQAPDSFTSSTIHAFALLAENDLTDGDGLFALYRSGPNLVFSVNEQGDVVVGGDATDASLAFGSGGAVGSNASGGSFISWAGTARLFADGAGARIPTRLYYSPDAETIADNGNGGTAAEHTLDVDTASNVVITCNDTNGCNITMDETPPANQPGTIVHITNVSANVVNFADTAGVSELAGTFAMGQYDALTLMYQTDRWVEISRSNN